MRVSLLYRSMKFTQKSFRPSSSPPCGDAASNTYLGDGPSAEATNHPKRATTVSYRIKCRIVFRVYLYIYIYIYIYIYTYIYLFICLYTYIYIYM